MAKHLRVGLYARVSTMDQNCSQQLQELRAHAEARGWTVQGEYVDRAVSGKQDSRPAMNELMNAARRRALDAVVCWKIDRWGRSMPHFVHSVRELDSLGVRFIATTQGIDTDQGNPSSKLMLNMLAAFAEFERELIVERTRAGLQRARREGRIGGRPRVVVDRRKIERLSKAGHSLVEIAKAVGTSKSTVHRLLTGERTKPHIVLSIPKLQGRKVTHVTATLMNWAVICDDADIKAQLEDLRPECLNYLPFPEKDWATLAERWLVAKVVSVHPPPSDYGEIPGVCFSGDH